MKREATFKCECGTEAPQSTRGGLRTKCPECIKIERRKYSADYYERRKSAPPVEITESVVS